MGGSANYCLYHHHRSQIKRNQTEGKNQLGEVIGQPKPGDLVKVHYKISIHGKKGYQIIDTSAHSMVSFRVAKLSSGHQGLYRGLNELIINGPMLLGDSVKAVLPPELAYDTMGLDRNYNVNGGFTQAAIENTFQMAAPNDPNAPASHQGRNPLSLAYVKVPPNTSIDIKLDLMQIEHHRRELKKMTPLDYATSGFMSGFGLKWG